MNTSDPPGGGVPDGNGIELPDLATEIARLANQMFGASPSVSTALAGGAAGVSPALHGPPVPGWFHSPPLAAAPFPKESDFRTLPATLSDGVIFDVPLPLGLTDSGVLGAGGRLPGGFSGGLPASAPSGLLYFLDLAGPPRAEATAPNLPGAEAVLAPVRPQVVPAPARGIFDPNAVKRDFPILSERVHGRPLVWLDNAATTQKPRAVIERLSYFYEHENSNVHRAAHALAARATDAYEGAREKVGRFLGAPSAQNIVFARGTTEAINLVAQSWGRRHISPGDEIVITWLEHHANIVPWQLLAAEKGARLRVAPVDDRGEVILEQLERLLGPRTRIVSVSQVSNALGTVVPVAEIVRMGHRVGARVLIDGAQAVSHIPVDVKALDCDFYCFSGHKVFGPTGIGALYGKPEVFEEMPPWQGGGNMIRDVTFERTSYHPAPWRFEAGTGNIADAVGLGAAIDYVTALGMPNIERYEHELLVYATEALQSVPGLRLIGTAPEKASVLSFVLDGFRTEDVGTALDQEGIAVRSGHHCAQPILRRYGLESTVRASLAFYNTRDDVDHLAAALRRLQTGTPPPRP